MPPNTVRSRFHVINRERDSEPATGQALTLMTRSPCWQPLAEIHSGSNLEMYPVNILLQGRLQHVTYSIGYTKRFLVNSTVTITSL